VTDPLRPMNLGEILDRTIQIYRSRLRVFVGLGAIPAMAMLGIQLAETRWLSTHSPAHPSYGFSIFWNYVYWLGFGQAFGFLILLISPALVLVASTAFVGDGSSIWEGLRFTAARWRSYLWIAVLKSTAELLIPQILIVALAVGEIVLASHSGGWKSPRVLAGAGTILAVAFPVVAALAMLLWVGPRLSLAIPAAALEKVRGFKALRRSWTLTKGRRVQILATWIVTSFLAWLLMFGAGASVQRIFISHWQAHIFGLAIQSLYTPTVYVVWDTIFALLAPIYPIAITLFYYDQRIRREGYDIERMMDEAGMIAPATPPAEAGTIARVAEEESTA